MANSIWDRCLNKLGLSTRLINKRARRDGRRWEYASERLEGRAMLSAASVAGPVTAEVAQARKAFDFPQVAGIWDVAITGFIDTTLVVTQDGNAVTADIVLPVIGNVTLSDKFTKKNHHELSGKVKLTDPELGKIRIQINIEFPEESNPTTFTGQATVTGKSVTEDVEYSLSGTKLLVQTSPLASGIPKVDFASVSGFWTISITGGPTPVQTVIRITQDGNGDKKIHGSVGPQGPKSIPADSRLAQLSLTLNGKFRTSNPQQVKGKALFRFDGDGLVKTKFVINFDQTFTAFDGTAHPKSGGDITLDGSLQDPP